MRRRTAARFGAALTGAVSLALLAVAAGAAALRGEPAPDFVLRSAGGPNLRLSEYRGEIVMLAFWASWCGDCRAQLDELDEMRDRYRDAGVELLAVSMDQNGSKTASLAADGRFPVLDDDTGEVGRLYDVSKLPAWVLIDRAGVVREVFEGYRRGNEQRYLDSVQALLRE